MIVDLFSGASSGTNTLNQPHDFRNPTPQNVNLTGWEVSVTEISLPAVWEVSQQPFQWLVERSPRQRTASDAHLDRSIYGALPFDNTEHFLWDDHVTWVGDGGTRLLFTLKRGRYETGEEVMLQMLRQIKSVFNTHSPAPTLKLRINNPGYRGAIREKGSIRNIAIYINQALERVLEVCGSRPYGVHL